MTGCSVCQLPADVRHLVDVEISRRTKFRTIAALCGLSKSTVHRHATKCLSRARFADHLAEKFNPRVNRLVISWPDDEVAPADFRGKKLNAYSGDEITQTRTTDHELVIEYAKPRLAPQRTICEEIADDKLSTSEEN
jgi:hypothetical protein